MTAYSEDNLSEKLQRLLPTQQSIQSMISYKIFLHLVAFRVALVTHLAAS